MPGEPGVPRPDRRFLAWLVPVALLAFVVREDFVLFSTVDVPIRGDIREYVAYAWNLIHHHTYSLVQPQIEPPAPDAYRTPGYAWLIAACMSALPKGDWLALVLQVQVLLGTATVVFTGLLARQWLPAWGALLAAALLAFWPHHIAACGAMLSEILFGFTLSAALYLFEKKRLAAAGAMFGFAYLVNPLIALFPPVLAFLHWRRASGTGRRATIAFCALFLLPVLAWSTRNATLDKSPDHRTGRLAINLVQGAWPLYHDAYRDSFAGNPIAKAVMLQINDDIRLMDGDPTAGFARLGERMAKDPTYYVQWYGWRKFWLLWDWDIRIGAGGPYFLQVRDSPLEKNPALHAIMAAYRLANPALTLLLLAGMLLVFHRAWRGNCPPGALHVALLTAYLTAVHVALQAEPRYANAYRGFEAIMVVTALAWISNRLSVAFKVRGQS